MRRLLALALVLWAGAAQAQVRTDAAGLKEIAARLLVQGEAERARDLARALLARNPEDAGALLLLARASLEAGDPEAALSAARRAHAVSEGPARVLAARVAARAHAELGEYTRAQLWLRGALGDAPDRAAREALGRDIRAVRARNPLAISLSFGAAPSSNINGGTSAETIWLWLPFMGGSVPTTPVGDALPLSGLRLSGAATLSYRIAQGERSATFLEWQLQGHTYVLSPDARDRAPDAEGSDYADASLSGSVVHRWRGEGASGPSAARITLGQSWYDGEPYTRFVQVSHDRSFALTGDDRLDLSVFADWTERREDSRGGIVHDHHAGAGLRGRWTREMESRDRASLSLVLRDHLDEIPDTTYAGAALGAGYDWARPVKGVRLGLSAELDWRSFDESRLVPDRRDDRRGTLRATLGLRDLEVWGFEPSLSLEASRTDSDADRIDKRSLTVDLGFRSAF